MINRKRETTNDVSLQGIVVHKFSTDKVTILTLSTGNSTVIPNYPKVVFFGELKTEADNYEKGDFVKVLGNIQSSKRNPEIKNQVLESIFAEKIEGAKSSMKEKFGVEGRYIPFKNEFNLSGTVVAVDLSTENILNVTVRTDKNGRPSFVRTTKFLNSGKAIDVSVGDFVYALGHIQTHKSEKNDEVKYFQNYVVSEFKIEPANS